MKSLIIIFVLSIFTYCVEASDRKFNAVIIGVTKYQGSLKTDDLKSFKLDKAACDMKESVVEIANTLGIKNENISIEILIDTDECKKKDAPSPTDKLIIKSLTRQLEYGKENDIFFILLDMALIRRY